MTDNEEKAQHSQRWNAYLYDGTNVLRNKDGITDAIAWAKQERIYTLKRGSTLPKLDVHNGSLADNLKAIHFHLFQDCYDWAGEFRDVNMSKGIPGSFCNYKIIPESLARMQALNDHLFKNASQLSTQDKLMALADLHASLNYIHPFREGNGRSTRAFMTATAKHINIKLDFDLVNKETMTLVSQLSVPKPHHVVTKPFREIYAVIGDPIITPQYNRNALNTDAIESSMDNSLLKDSEKQKTPTGLSDDDITAIEQVADYSLTTDNTITTTRDTTNNPDTYQPPEPEQTPELEL